MPTNLASLVAQALLAGLLVASGCGTGLPVGGPCGAHTDKDGHALSTDGSPCKQQFYFPTGITVDPDGDVAYVSNGNADLRYSGGTVAAVDLAFFECARQFVVGNFDLTKVDADCVKNYGPRLKDQIVSYVDPTTPPPPNTPSKALYKGCRQDLNDPLVIECDEDPFIVDGVRVGNFGSSLRVQNRGNLTLPFTGSCPPGTTQVAVPDSPDPSVPKGVSVCQGAQRRLWLPVRGDPSITYIGIQKSSGSQSVKLLCHTGSASNVNAGDDCSGQRIVVRDFHSPSYPGNDCQSDHSTCVNLPTEPFGLALDEGMNGGTPYSRLLVSHLSTGEVTLIDASVADPTSLVDHKPGEPVVLDVRRMPFAADTAGRLGAFSLAPRVPGQPHDYWYVTSRVNALIAVFRIADANVILPALNIPLSGGPFFSGNDVRDIAFDPCTPANPGCRAFFVQNNPPSVFTLDTRIETQSAPVGLPRDQVVDIVDVCQGPSHLAFRHFETPGGPVDRVYAVCFGSGQVAVIDPNLALLVNSVLVGRGPNEITFNFGPDVKVQPTHPRAYVTNYLDMNVTVVDLEPGSATENHVIGRIGITEPPVIQ